MVCRTFNDWEASQGPRDFRICAPHPLGDFGIAQDIYDDRAPCSAVEHALNHGAFTPATLPLSPTATFSTPGWSCQTANTASRSWICSRGKQRFKFVVWS